MCYSIVPLRNRLTLQFQGYFRHALHETKVWRSFCGLANCASADHFRPHETRAIKGHCRRVRLKWKACKEIFVQVFALNFLISYSRWRILSFRSPSVFERLLIACCHSSAFSWLLLHNVSNMSMIAPDACSDPEASFVWTPDFRFLGACVHLP
jgi:hypothetical protein